MGFCSNLCIRVIDWWEMLLLLNYSKFEKFCFRIGLEMKVNFVSNVLTASVICAFRCCIFFFTKHAVSFCIVLCILEGWLRHAILLKTKKSIQTINQGEKKIGCITRLKNVQTKFFQFGTRTCCYVSWANPTFFFCQVIYIVYINSVYRRAKLRFCYFIFVW